MPWQGLEYEHSWERSCLNIAGIDGCKGGWIAVTERHGTLDVKLWPRFTELFTAEWDMVMVDIPIGLVESGRRHCDNLARGELGRRRSSVFFAPTRSQSSATQYEEVRVQGMSLQTFYLLSKIREVDGEMTPSRQARVREAHPELAYSVRSSLELSKKRTAPGREQRQSLLAHCGSAFRLSDWQGSFLRREVGLDDLLDAAVLLEVARDWLSGKGRCVGGEHHDSRGLRMEICF